MSNRAMPTVCPRVLAIANATACCGLHRHESLPACTDAKDPDNDGPMRAVIQRARDANVRVEGQVVGGYTGLGLVALIGVTHTDTPGIAARLAERIWHLRIFERPTGAGDEMPAQCSAADLKAPVLLVSQFTLYAQTGKGRRPSWDMAAPGSVAEPLIARLVSELIGLGAEVSTGIFGATMAVSLINEGPMTLILDVDDPPPVHD